MEECNIDRSLLYLSTAALMGLFMKLNNYLFRSLWLTAFYFLEILMRLQTFKTAHQISNIFKWIEKHDNNFWFLGFYKCKNYSNIISHSQAWNLTCFIINRKTVSVDLACTEAWLYLVLTPWRWACYLVTWLLIVQITQPGFA